MRERLGGQLVQPLASLISDETTPHSLDNGFTKGSLPYSLNKK